MAPDTSMMGISSRLTPDIGILQMACFSLRGSVGQRTGARQVLPCDTERPTVAMGKETRAEAMQLSANRVVGAEVTQVDVRALDDAAFAALDHALLRHQMLAIRDQELT